ncbi:hypothetical protein VTK26DRAFT_4076 [Humicola hyalothermophila]
MDAFVTRRKRKLSPENADLLPAPSAKTADAEQDEPTDLKLAILSSLHPGLEQETLLDILLAHDGNVEATSKALKGSRFVGKPGPGVGAGPGVTTQTSLRPFTVCSGGSSDTSPPPKRTKILSRKGTTLHLYDPQDVSEHTPCTIIHNFLPADEANALLLELLEESKSFEKTTFKLFDNVVSSPHTSALYVGHFKELQEHKDEYVYNGSRMTDVRTLTPWLERVRGRVQEAVNREIQERIRTRYGGKKLKYQSPDPWTPNAAFVNCYNGPQESVGWHSDQLTYLGPRPVIGSLSLGVAREFRVRRILPPAADPDANPKETSSAANDGQIAIHLPHNSLLVMHAEMQEGWKHSISPAQTVSPHPVAGGRRINVTYRHYRSGLFHPRHTPRCDPPCGVPAVLRVVTKKRENWGRYFWMCHAGNVPGKEACGFFRWAEFDEDGNPIGIRPPGGGSGAGKGGGAGDGDDDGQKGEEEEEVEEAGSGA